MDIRDKINQIKKAKNAIIVAHYYQSDEIQEIADFVGDSLELSRLARDNKADIIVFCGVDFMAGSAKLLSPEKTVLLPEHTATCPMANMASPEEVIKLKEKYPNALVVTYINSTVEVKTVSDICCTSANAIKVVNALECDKIIFVPDKNLGNYVSKHTDKEVILWNGYCGVHNGLTLSQAKQALLDHPDAEFVVHPECLAEVIDIADYCGSTSQIINYVKKSIKKEFIVGTEKGILYQLKKENPDKTFYLAHQDMVCSNMKKISLERLLECLTYETHKIELEKDVIERAALPVERMLEIK